MVGISLLALCLTYVLLFAANDEDLLGLRLGVGAGGYDHEPVEQIDGDAVGGLVVGAPDLGDSTVGGDDQDGGHVALEGAVEPGEALHVEHVHLVDK